MKLINIPGLCAIPRIFDAAKDLFTAEEDETPKVVFTADDFNAALKGRTKALNELIEIQEKELQKATEQVTIEIDIPEDVINDLAKIAAEQDKEDSKNLEDTWVYEKPVQQYTPPKFIEPTPPKVATTIGGGTVDERLAKALALQQATTPNGITTTAIKKRKKAKYKKKDMSEITTAEWDCIHFRDQQRIAWNLANPNSPKRTRIAMYDAFNVEFGMCKGHTIYNNILVTTSKQHRTRDSYSNPKDGRNYIGSGITHVNQFKDIKDLYEE